ncbi:hypothetical protein BCR36DRAFT_583552 [Piromyces finnis]|uniref:Uncharacterized protein n=1 Tax=Piromyces finnis TaxID=1754191 RepID=A0A1Y1V8I9_9FUNG|nr:hypothetical protein BCR36DRAFT_583552 [Piromyces finnis]|eukprot:ORX49944.1 hypothetical protein BCR36DRAFT_583552 [Piromyces finnis]
MVNLNEDMKTMNTNNNNNNNNNINMNTLVDINNCITANIIYIELGGIRFMVDLAILRLFPESILITMFPTGIPLVNIKQQYKSLARLQQFFLKLVKVNIRSIENYPFDVNDFTNEEEFFVNPNLSPMDEMFILYINFDPNLFEFLYKYFCIKFTKMQYLKFVEQYEEGEANNIDMSDIQQIKNLFYITISQQIILVLREEIEFFVIPAVTLESSENQVEQTNSIVQLYNKDVCNLEFMHQLKNVCSQFLIDRKNVLVKLNNITEMEDVTKAHIYLEELAKIREDKSSSLSRFSIKGGSKQKRNYAILNTLNILTKIQGNSTWGYRARESNKTKINSIAMLLVNLPINPLNPNYEFGMEEEEEHYQPQPQQIPAQTSSTITDNSYNNNNNTNESLHYITTTTVDTTNNSMDKTNNSVEGLTKASATNENIKHELKAEIIPEEVEESVNQSDDNDDGDDDGDDESYEIPPRPLLLRPYGNNQSFIVLNDMADNSFDSHDHSRVLHHSKSSNNIDTGNYDGENTELFESHTDICEGSSYIFKSCNTLGNSRNSLPVPIQDSQFLYHSCLEVDGSRVDTDSFESIDNIESKLDIDNIDNIENKLEEIHMKCSDENSVILHSSIREIVRNPSKDEENLKIISYIQDEVSDIPHDSIILNNTTITATNTTVTTDIINSSPLANSDNEIIPIIVPSNDKPVSPSSTVATFDEQENGNEGVEQDINHHKVSSNNIIYNGTETEHTTDINITDSSYTTTDEMTNEIVMPEISNMVTQVEPEPEYNQEAMNNTLSILQPCRNFWWESVPLHLELPKNKYQITENLKLDVSDIKFSNIEVEDIKEQEYNIDDIEATLDFIDLKLWLRRQWTVEFCAV